MEHLLSMIKHKAEEVQLVQLVVLEGVNPDFYFALEFIEGN